MGSRGEKKRFGLCGIAWDDFFPLFGEYSLTAHESSPDSCFFKRAFRMDFLRLSIHRAAYSRAGEIELGPLGGAYC